MRAVRNFERWTMTLLAGVTLAMPLALWAVFLYAPEERVMGAAQKIFYFHVPAAMITYSSVAVLLAGSLGYLWTRNRKWDDLSIAATEVGLLFCTLVLITGPIWARPAWGAWWTWEARLTTTLLLWLLLLACLMVRDYADNRDLGARLASIVGIVAALDVPIIHKAVVWWRGQHPVVFAPNQSDGLAPAMRTSFVICIVAMFGLFALLIVLRYRLATLEGRLHEAVETLGREEAGS